jgi:hypothetical protein
MSSPVPGKNKILKYVHQFALMMEEASTSETSANFYQITRRKNLENSHHTRRRENLKSHMIV